MRVGGTGLTFDLNYDGRLDALDLEVWVQHLAHIWHSDADFSGSFDSGDLVTVLSAGQYEDELAGNSPWGTGDWNGDGEFDTSDLLIAFQGGRLRSRSAPGASGRAGAMHNLAAELGRHVPGRRYPLQQDLIRAQSTSWALARRRIGSTPSAATSRVREQELQPADRAHNHHRPARPLDHSSWCGRRH